MEQLQNRNKVGLVFDNAENNRLLLAAVLPHDGYTVTNMSIAEIRRRYPGFSRVLPRLQRVRSAVARILQTSGSKH
jgi:hypothetical protein